ncbi:MAG TPA: DUF6256 family protein [Actinomycetes bacterium]|nr:DUF6256 family protein [Actinomycetes bacterium]
MSVGDLPEMHAAAGVVSRSRLIGSIGWAVIFGAFVSWEAIGLMVGHGWPTLSHVTRAVTRLPVGRWVLFGAWLWLGWHLFIRGWQFFLRGPLGEGPQPGGAASGVREMLAEFLVLGATLSLAVAGMARYGGRHAEQPSSRRPVGFGGLVLGILLVAASCYVVLVGFVVLFVLVAGSGQSHLLRGAATGGAILAFGVAAPGFLLLSLVDAAIARLRGRRSATAP